MVDERKPSRFWELGDQLVAEPPIVIDRPRGSVHPRHPSVIYPFDYGYLAGTGAIVTVDMVKADSEVKWLVGCTADEMQLALRTHRTEWQAAILIVR